jgi:hypothetical protein
MPDTRQSPAERHIERIMSDLDPGSDRYHVLDTARRFKSSWVELGERLTEVSSRTLYQEWGYSSFDDYCQGELRLRKQTADKLKLAYRFLERQEPDILRRHRDMSPAPDYRSVELLRQAREERGFSDDEYATLRKSMVDEERSHPTVARQFKELVRERGDEPANPAASLKQALAAARRLDTALREVSELPPPLRQGVVDLIRVLEEEVENLRVI